MRLASPWYLPVCATSDINRFVSSSLETARGKAMTSLDHVKIEQDGDILTIRISREEARNALNLKLLRELTEVARAYKTTPSINTIIVTGTPEYFSAGADLSERNGSNPTLLERREIVMAGPDMCKAWAEIEPVTIAAIEGYCIGGAVSLATSCDFRIMGDGSYMRLPEVPLGINMSWRTLPRLTALMGPSRAKQFVMFGQKLEASWAAEWGLADDVSDKGDAYNVARAWAQKVSSLPPLPVRMTKEAIDAAAHMNDPTPTFMDRDQYLLTAQSNDFKEGVSAFFEKRDPDFKGD